MGQESLSLHGTGNSTARLDQKSGESVACSLVVFIGSILPSIIAAHTLALVELALPPGSNPLLLASAARTKPGRGKRKKRGERSRERSREGGGEKGRKDRERRIERHKRQNRNR